MVSFHCVAVLEHLTIKIYEKKRNANQKLQTTNHLLYLAHPLTLPLVFERRKGIRHFFLHQFSSTEQLIFEPFVIVRAGRVGYYDNIFRAKCFLATLPGTLCS